MSVLELEIKKIPIERIEVNGNGTFLYFQESPSVKVNLSKHQDLHMGQILEVSIGWSSMSDFMGDYRNFICTISPSIYRLKDEQGKIIYQDINSTYSNFIDSPKRVIKCKNFSYSLSLDDLLKLDEDEKWDFIDVNLVGPSNEIENIFRKDYSGEKDPHLLNHHLAYEYVLQNFEQRMPNEKDIKKLHKILMSKLMTSAGNYRENEVCILKRIYNRGDLWGFSQGAMHYRSIKKHMGDIEKEIKILSGEDLKREEMWNSHYKFETIHPFNDGNGRTGRLILNWLSLRLFEEFITIDSQRKQEYYREIKEYQADFKETHPNIFYKNYFTRKKGQGKVKRIDISNIPPKIMERIL